MTVSELLNQGIAACRAGRKAEARALLEKVIELDDHNEAAWLWLSGAVDADEERQICLENVLTINPNNELARRGMARLAQAAARPQAPPPSAQPAPPRPESPPPSAQPAPPRPESPPPPAQPALRPQAPLSRAQPAPPRPQPAVAPEPARPVAQAAPSPIAAGAGVYKAALPFDVPPTPGGVTGPQAQAPKQDKQGVPVVWWVGGGILLLMVLLIACSVLGLALGNQVQAASTPTPVPDHRSAIMAVIRENVDAHNAEDRERYMDTIHYQAAGRLSMRATLDQMYSTYDLDAKLYNLKILELSDEEARVSFTLITKRINGPAFRDNQIDGVMILRPDKGRWKLYNQENNSVTYLD